MATGMLAMLTLAATVAVGAVTLALEPALGRDEEGPGTASRGLGIGGVAGGVVRAPRFCLRGPAGLLMTRHEHYA